LLFNIALEKVIRYAKINTRGGIFCKSVQIFAYADDIDIVGRSQVAVKEVFISLEKAAKKMGLQVNKGKAKYMPVTKKDYAHISSHIEIGSYQFETVHSFTYLGSEVNCKNDVSAEIKKKYILSANRCFHGRRKHFKSQLKSRKTKMTLYKVVVRPVAT
jgi:4-hydroxy-L-threonine phosphate dehydrogenase PdxA